MNARTDLGDIRERRVKRAKALAVALDEALAGLRELGALRVVLFGSFARGDIDVDSDLDLLVVMPDSKSGHDWTRLVYDRVPRNVAVDFLVYARDEWERELPRNSFLRHIETHGRVVYEKTAP